MNDHPSGQGLMVGNEVVIVHEKFSGKYGGHHIAFYLPCWIVPPLKVQNELMEIVGVVWVL